MRTHFYCSSSELNHKPAPDENEPAVIAHFIAHTARRILGDATDELSPHNNDSSMAFSLNPVVVQALRNLANDAIDSYVNLLASGEPSPLLYQWL